MNFIKLLNNEFTKNKNLGKNKWGVPVFGVVEDLNDKFWISEKNTKVEPGIDKDKTHVEYKLLNHENIKNNLNKKIMYITTEPCPSCAKAIVDNGTIGKVYYLFDNKTIKNREYLDSIKIMRFTTKSLRMNMIIDKLQKEWESHQERVDKLHKKKKK